MFNGPPLLLDHISTRPAYGSFHKAVSDVAKSSSMDHTLSRPVHGNFHRSASDMVTNLHVGSYFTQAFMEIFIKQLVMW